MSVVEPTVDAFLSPHPLSGSLLAPAPARTGISTATGRHHRHRRHGAFFGPALSPRRARVSVQRSSIVLPAGWSGAVARWTGTLVPPRSGLYTFSIEGSGGGNLTLNGKTAVSDTLSHPSGVWSGSMSLTAHRPYHLELDWQPFTVGASNGPGITVPSQITLGWSDVTNQIRAAVTAARHASVAVVFAGDYGSEGFDRPSLSLPGDENQLIDAVAAANPRTVVVLDTGGPVLMPWRHRVAGMLEDVVSRGRGRRGDRGRCSSAMSTRPGSCRSRSRHATPPLPSTRRPVAGGRSRLVAYSEGLDVGYRYDHATGRPTCSRSASGSPIPSFALSRLRVERAGRGIEGHGPGDERPARSGTDVAQAYLTIPRRPVNRPGRLVAFRSGQARRPSERRRSPSRSPRRRSRRPRWSPADRARRLHAAVGESSSDLPLSTPSRSSAELVGRGGLEGKAPRPPQVTARWDRARMG